MAYDRPDRRIYGFAKWTRCWLGARLWPMIRYMDRNSIAISQLLNTLLGGEPHETLSSRTWRYLLHNDTDMGLPRHPMVWLALLLAAVLEVLERDHCAEAYRRAYTRARIMNIERLPPVL